MNLHKNLTAERWFELSIAEQLANVGADVGRAINWRNRGDWERSRRTFECALELLDFTIADPKNRQRLKEPVRMRELMVDYFVYDNIYNSTDEFFENYFYYFAYVAAAERGK